MTTDPVLQVKHIRKSFGNLEVLKGISLDAHEGDVVSILGASGSGKSTFLRCINLLEVPDAGEIRVAGEQVVFKRGRHQVLVPANRRQVDRMRPELGMVFQSFGLWSHMTVLQNVTFPGSSGTSVRRRRARARRSRSPALWYCGSGT